MLWLILAIGSYFLNAVVSLVDKFLLSNKVKSPFVYAFYSGVLTSVVFVLWPPYFSLLSPDLTIIALFAGACFFVAVFFFYSAVLQGEVSSVVPVVGGISPVVVFVLSFIFLGERLPPRWLLGFSALVLGTLLFTLGKGKKVSAYSFAAAVFFAASFFFSKIVFDGTVFLNGFIWTRIGAILPPIILLFFPFFRKILLRSDFNVKKRSFFLFVSNKGLSAVAFLLFNYAIALGSVTIISAVQGVQYVFLFVLTLVFSAYFPRIISESLRREVIIQKIAGIALISLALIILFVFDGSI